jgi:glycine/D-amino acid oxidase-like deaminating enzyme
MSASSALIRARGLPAMTDVAVIGAGAFGTWTALHLAEAGLSVTLVDMFGVGNDRSSSGGESRNIRAAYAHNAFYTRWAREAWRRWLEREVEFGVRLVYSCGSVRAGTPAELAEQSRLFAEIGAPWEQLRPDEVTHRWPQISPVDENVFYEPESGVLAAARALQAVERAFCAHGGSVVQGVARLTGDGASTRVEVDGRALYCDTIVLACGPWLPRLLPGLLSSLIRTPRRELVFIAPPPGDTRYGWERCPNLVDALGWTSADLGNGVKIAPPMKGIDMNPDEPVRLPSRLALRGAEVFVRARLPGLVGRPVVSTFVSQLENTATEDFIIDRHPEAPRLLIAGGGSGHAFKFGPVLGDYVAKAVLAGSAGEHVHRFGLAAHRPLRPGEGA